MLSRNDFLKLVLPTLGDDECYCIFGIKNEFNKSITDQKFFTSVESLSKYADKLVSNSYNIFFGLSSFSKSDGRRTRECAKNTKSFFLDLDCGENKPFPDLASGIVALKKFVQESGLPSPTIVKSGKGAHIYWPLEEDLPHQKWHVHAQALKKKCTDYNFSVDPVVTCDVARILRMPETYHLKDKSNPILVEVIKVSKPMSLQDVERLLPPVGDVLDVGVRGKYDLDEATNNILGRLPTNFKIIMMKSLKGEGCNQLKFIAENQAITPEPLWRAGLSVAQVCEDRNTAIHVISRNHPNYSVSETELKASRTTGPHGCDVFKGINPSGCEGCTHSISTPALLGKVLPTQKPEDFIVVSDDEDTGEKKTYTLPKYPLPFSNGPNGSIIKLNTYKSGEVIPEGQDGCGGVLVYPFPFYVVKRMNDPDLGETMLLRLHLPKDGVRDFVMSLNNVMAKDKFVSTVSSFGVAAYGKDQDNLMYYITKWIDALQNAGKAEAAFRQFGWTEDRKGIILGETIYHHTGKEEYTPPSAPTIPLVPMFQKKGDLETWKDIINVYARPGMEPRAFAFFMGFGSFLLNGSVLDGFLLNLYSRESGSGKTTILQAINSIYGKPRELLLSPKDTYNARINRLGVMQSLATTMDEITNMPVEQMSNQIYDVTSGKGKNRLQQYGNAERNNHTKWQTGLITSSNRSVADALLAYKGFPDGDLKRIMEIKIAPDPYDNATWAREHFGRMMDNYGLAGPIFAQALAGDPKKYFAMLANTQTRLEQDVEIRNSERYWAIMASIAITGGHIANSLNLHNIPIPPVYEYACELIRSTRERHGEFVLAAEDFLGGYLQRHFNEILVINAKVDARTGMDFGPIKEPKGQLNARFEPDTQRLYVVKSSYQKDCTDRHMNCEDTLAIYRVNQALLKANSKEMAKGTSANAGTSVSVLCFDTSKLAGFNEKAFLRADSDEDDGID